MTPGLDAPLSLLARDFRELAAGGSPLVLASVVRTAGSTYRKAGARMLIGGDGTLRGLLSGGCLEHDLREFAREVLATGQARLVRYDMRSPDDLLFGLGAGCEGAMDILLQPVGPDTGWQPLAAMAVAAESPPTGSIAVVVASDVTGLRPGDAWWDGGHSARVAEWPALAQLRADARRTLQPACVEVDTAGDPGSRIEVFVAPLVPPPALLLLGAGPDAAPVAQLAATLGLRVTVVDHRPAYAVAERFPGCRVLCADADAVDRAVDPGAFDAALVMSHHLESDATYLRALALRGPAYVGLLGPAARRQRLLAGLGVDAGRLDGRLRGPVGLDIGARTPEAIAVAVVAEIHAFLAGRPGQPFSAGGSA